MKLTIVYLHKGRLESFTGIRLEIDQLIKDLGLDIKQCVIAREVSKPLGSAEWPPALPEPPKPYFVREDQDPTRRRYF